MTTCAATRLPFALIDRDAYWTVQRDRDGLFRGVLVFPSNGARIHSIPLTLRDAMLWARKSLRLITVSSTR